MELEPMRQAAELLKRSRTPLISIPEQPTTDAIAAALSLLLVLEKMGQHPRIVSPRFSLPTNHAFLPKSDAIEQGLSNLRDFIISVNLEKTKLESLRYAIDHDTLHIHLTPKQGFYEPRDVSTSAGEYAHDLIIAIDAQSLESLGDIYEENIEFFLHTPTINVDHHPGNTRFGNVQLVDVVANAASEIVFELIQRLGQEHMSEQVATTILAGIMSKTKAFQSQHVTPRSLSVASHLVTAGARRDEIVKNLYQTKSLATLKLWGVALTRLQATPDQKIVWTWLKQSDLRAGNASPQEATGVLDELMVSSPNADYYALFIESNGQVEVIFTFPPHQPPSGLPEAIEPVSREQARGHLQGGLEQVQETVLAKLRQTPKR